MKVEPNIDIQIEHWPVDRLVPKANNPRTHTREQVAKIAASIREWGWTNPILVGEDNEVIAGHARLLAARKLDMQEVPVIVLRHLSVAQRRALVIADNELAIAGSGWDAERLKAELALLREESFRVELLGFDDAELAGLLEQNASSGLVDEDEVPLPPPFPCREPEMCFCLANTG